MKDSIKKTGGQEKKTIVSNLQTAIIKFADEVDGFVYPLIIPPIQSIDEEILFEIYPDLRIIGKQEKLHVLLYSYGGDAHTAFHIGRLLQTYSTDLSIYILREAKSAATLISCAADRIIFSEISELGPMDPQIRRSDMKERFSPLAIKHTFDFLHAQSEENHSQIVKALTEKLPDPLILGEHLKSLETGKDYLCKLMKKRMFKDGVEKVAEISEKLVTGYPDHSYCIDFDEAKDIGLRVEKIEEKHEEIILDIMRSYKNVWDKFDFQIKRARNIESTKEKDRQFEEASELYGDLKKLAKNVIKHQKDKQKDTSAPNNKKGKK